MTMRLIVLGVLFILFASCKEPPQGDTERDIFPHPEDLTHAREMNIAKWTADFLRKNGRLPDRTSELPLPSPRSEAKDNPLNDAWGHPILLVRVGSGYELRSIGADGTLGTADDIVYRVDDPAGAR